VNVAAVRLVAYSLGGLLAAVGSLALVGLTFSANASLSTKYTAPPAWRSRRWRWAGPRCGAAAAG